jgi:hypothetical protein
MIRNLLSSAATVSVVLCAQIALAQAGATSAPTASGAPSSGAYSNPYGYPGFEVQAVPRARADSVRARLEYDKSRRDLETTVLRAYDDFEFSPEITDLKRQEAARFAAFDAARTKALATLNSDHSYNALRRLVRELDERIDRESASASSAQERDQRVAPLAELKLSYAKTISSMESAALAADQDVASARTALLESTQQLAGLRRDFRRQLVRSDLFADARHAFEMARINSAVAESLLDSAIEARNIAMNFAYYVNNDRGYSYSYDYAYDYSYRHGGRRYYPVAYYAPSVTSASSHQSAGYGFSFRYRN